MASKKAPISNNSIPNEGVAAEPANYKDELYPKFFSYNPRKEILAIKFHEFIEYLKILGFRRLDVQNDFVFVRIIDGIAEECSITKIQDVFFKVIGKADFNLYDGHGNWIFRRRLVEKIYKGLKTYFSKNLLSRLGSINDLKFLEDGKDHSFFCFNNCAIKVHKDGIDILDYKELTGKIIWRNSILKYDFWKIDADKVNESVIARFIKNLSKAKDSKGINVDDLERCQALKTIIGYNLHSYFETKLKATILTDTGVTDDANGRTGKTLIMKAIGKMLNAKRESTTFVEISGKSFDFNKPFRYEQCEVDTKLVHLNDVRNKFQFELLYNDITEGITVEGKNKKSFVINSKIAISTNRTIRLNGASDRDRAIEFQVSDHYSPEYSPSDEFKHWFFRDWDKDQWNEFFNYMIDCVRMYFICGLQQPENIDLDERKLVAETSKEFKQFMDTFFDAIEDGKRYSKKDLHSQFIEEFTDFSKLRQRTFTEWLCKWSKMDTRISSHNEPRSNGIDFISFDINEKITSAKK